MAGPAYAPGKAPALGEVLSVAWVVGVGGSPDLEVTFDGRAGHPVEAEHAALALFGMVSDAKAPFVPGRGEVCSLLPGQGFLGVASVNPAPYFVPDVVVQFAEDRFGGSVAVIIGPTAQERVELAQERRLTAARSGVKHLSDLLAQGLHFSLGGKDQQFIPKFAQGVPQKVQALLEGGDDGLLL